MNGKLYEDAVAVTPVPGTGWGGMTEVQRLETIVRVAEALGPAFAALKPVAARDDGQVTFLLQDDWGPARRGTALLDMEEALKQAVDRALTVWLQPLSDRNALRNLRGIEVKS